MTAGVWVQACGWVVTAVELWIVCLCSPVPPSLNTQCKYVSPLSNFNRLCTWIPRKVTAPVCQVADPFSIHFRTNVCLLFSDPPSSPCCRRGGGRPGSNRSLQVIRWRHRPAAHRWRGAAPQPVLSVWRWLHPGPSGHPLPEARHASHPAHRGKHAYRFSLSSPPHWN